MPELNRPRGTGPTLESQMQRYHDWRTALAGAIRRYERLLTQARRCDADERARIARMLERLADDRLTVAFVAEFSRGKSELINAIFFGDAGRRIVPSAAGRTTMCPTELLHDPQRAPSIRLLPVETRIGDAVVSALREIPHAWHEIFFDPDDAAALGQALASVRETIRVPRRQAAAMGFSDEDFDQQEAATGLAACRTNRDESVEVPRWRHAIVNHPHPLLRQGLRIVDTPGLNAIGAEPELTLRLIPEADAVLFVLAADAGVTRSDIEVWREHVAPNQASGRFVVLNKIDGLWDGLRDEAAIELEIAGQVDSVARTLGLAADRVFPVSAQKALLARLRDDPRLLRRSRLADLERALAGELVPRRRELMRERLQRAFDALHGRAAAALAGSRRIELERQLELESLRGRKRRSVGTIAARVQRERDEFDRNLRKLQALRAVFARHAQGIGDAVGPDVIRRHIREARELMFASHFSSGMREAMAALLACARADFDEASRHLAEVDALMAAMYRSFALEHGMALGEAPKFTMGRYHEALGRIEQVYRRQFGALTLVTTGRHALMGRFFEMVAVRMRELYEKAANDSQSWQRALMAPIESQVREHRLQLRRRAEAVGQVLEASESLEWRIAEVGQLRDGIEREQAALDEAARQVRELLASGIDRAAESDRAAWRGRVAGAGWAGGSD